MLAISCSYHVLTCTPPTLCLALYAFSDEIPNRPKAPGLLRMIGTLRTFQDFELYTYIHDKLARIY